MILALKKQRPRKTVQDFMRLPADTRAELIDGELLMSPAPKTPHQRAVGNLFGLLFQHARSHSTGEVFIAPFDVHLPTGDVVEPDIIFVANANAGIVQDWIRGVPDLVIEVVSPDGVERDRIVKRELYAQNGIRKYWIVDPQTRTVEIFSPAGNRYEPNGYFEAGESVASPLLPEFKIKVADIFE